MIQKRALTLVTGIFLMIFLAVSVQAVTITPIEPTTSNISLMCGEFIRVNLRLSLNNETVSVSLPIKPTLSGLHIGFEKTYFTTPGVSDQQLYIYYFTEDSCSTGTETNSFNIGGQTYPITVDVSKEQYLIFDENLLENEQLNIGSDVSLILFSVGHNVATYKLTGCDTGSSRITIQEGQVKEYECEGESLKVELVQTFESIEAIVLKIHASENWLTSISESNETDESGCILGLDTLGAKVKRGNIFAIKTINANTGKFIDSVAVTILDQQGELSPVAGVSSNIGFFSERLHEDFKQDLIVQLEKEGCEPSTQVILFEQSYDDYKKAKGEEEGTTQLVLNMSGRFEINTAVSNAVKNDLGEAIDGATVRITFPDNAYLDVITDANGGFSFTPSQVGKFKLQTSKDGYTPSGMSEIEIFENKEYLIVIKVEGESKSEYKKDDRITFELVDINHTIIPLTIDATFAGLPIKFISGISDAVIFEDTCALDIPATGGYRAQQIQLTAKESGWGEILVWIGIIVGGLVLLIIVVVIIKKLKGSSSSSGKGGKMEIQLGEPGE